MAWVFDPVWFLIRIFFFKSSTLNKCSFAGNGEVERWCHGSGGSDCSSSRARGDGSLHFCLSPKPVFNILVILVLINQSCVKKPVLQFENEQISTWSHDVSAGSVLLIGRSGSSLHCQADTVQYASGHRNM